MCVCFHSSNSPKHIISITNDIMCVKINLIFSPVFPSLTWKSIGSLFLKLLPPLCRVSWVEQVTLMWLPLCYFNTWFWGLEAPHISRDVWEHSLCVCLCVCTVDRPILPYDSLCICVPALGRFPTMTRTPHHMLPCGFLHVVHFFLFFMMKR